MPLSYLNSVKGSEHVLLTSQPLETPLTDTRLAPAWSSLRLRPPPPKVYTMPPWKNSWGWFWMLEILACP